MYDEAFYSEPFVTHSIFRLLLQSKPLHIQNLMHSKYRETLKYSLHRILCNLGIFTTLAYSIRTEFCQTFMMGRFLQGFV